MSGTRAAPRTRIAALAAQLQRVRETTAPPVVVLTRYAEDALDALNEEIARAEASGSLVVIVCKEEAPPR